MRISYNWLKEYIESELSIETISEILTSIGLEVEGVEHFESVKGGLKKFYIGEVLTCIKHPNADKLSLTEVDLGTDLGVRKIVCGAPNVAQGQKVVVATEGAIIYLPGKDSFEIKNSKIRGEESQGMICAEDELGLGTNHDGILVLDSSAEVGTPASEFFELYHDVIFEIGLTPNRTDAMCHKGVARDLAAALKSKDIKHSYFPNGKSTFSSPKNRIENPFKTSIQTEGAPVFNTCFIENIENLKSPLWISNRLKAVGESPRNLLVDITNYILHDLGQPLHAYDASKIKGRAIRVTNSKEKQEMKALNQLNYKLDQGDILIEDEEKILGLAGIIGSDSSAIDEKTQTILLEAAYFNRKSIRMTSQRLHLKSEASSKFEKGIDPNGVKIAIGKAVDILASLVPDAAFSNIDENQNLEFPFHEVSLRLEQLNLYGNMSFEPAKVEGILTSLGIEIAANENKVWSLRIPRFKEDVTREEDVIEEVLRIYGYNLLPYPKYLKSSLSFSKGISRTKFEEKISNLLVGKGFSEIMTNSISQSRYYPDQSYVKLLNSMTAELDSMRAEIVPSVLEVIEYNVNREAKDISFFEFGTSYSYSDASYKETKSIVLAITGNQSQPNWSESKGKANDYFRLKESLENMMEMLNIEYAYAESENPAYHYGLSIHSGEKRLGYFGQYKISKELFDIKQNSFVAELDFEAIYKLASSSRIQYQEVSKFPQVRRDLALLIGNEITFSAIESICKKTLKSSLVRVGLFDVFRDKSLGESKKSYAIRLILENREKTLEEKEIDSMMTKLVKNLTTELSAEIRS